MSRYIDADALKEKKVYSVERHECVVPVAEIDWQPTADVVEVVRCKDCKHFGKDLGYGKHDCKKYEMPYCLETDYCSYGERREE